MSAYVGQGPRLKQVPVIRAALAIHSVEARHAAWIRNIVGMNPSPAAFDPAAPTTATPATEGDAAEPTLQEILAEADGAAARTGAPEPVQAA